MAVRGAAIPPEVWEKIRSFLDAGKTGTITLDVKDGHVLSGNMTEHFRLARRQFDSNPNP